MNGLATHLPRSSLWVRYFGETLGSALIVVVVILAAVVPHRLFLANESAVHIITALCGAVTVASFALITVRRAEFHFNPLLTLIALSTKRLDFEPAIKITVLQILGAFAGVALAHSLLNFDPLHAATLRPFTIFAVLAEFIAAFILMLAVGMLATSLSPFKVAAFAGLLFFVLCLATPYFSMMNPAVTLARTMTATAITLSPQEAMSAAVAQLFGAACAGLVQMKIMEALSSARRSLTVPE